MAEASSFMSFVNDCRNRGVHVDWELVDQPRRDDDICYQPGTWYAAIAAAANILRKNPEAELVDKPIDEDRMPDGFPQTVLRQILNASLNRVSSPYATTFFCESAESVDCCTDAERWFGHTLHALANPRRTQKHGQPLGWRIITDGDEPLAITKTLGQRSTLALVPFTVNGIPYPAGSLLRAEDVRQTYLRDEQRVCLPVEALARVACLRVSAFALPPEQRRATFSQAFGPFDALLVPALFWPMDKIRAVAQAAIGRSLPSF